ncbi:hypothetical protein SPRG_15428 [Saprolegnia parasitica CBS 223.65]|uniref:PH domain-containing protein n=1 Tax=Saprolegnia parasitica (strain CBS 223.65) TaxID=695850 RepID=A0A067BMJ2_SAPPC|nr:hypothetical protein SPRG_15428 [Saprolegnia parasitica CBS 223.65]KDO19438.1 hypothetical protein SPRG_15428 [Saprolegnia parasitica CBS 223.65]|eukprot:XP_012209864.1 hypothetical protein SPRG_15428 [Saprolegnia parasitica CBS 223.65]
MGQSLAKAVDEKGKRVKNPTWSGWLHIYKNGLLKRGYKRRFCRLDRDRLYYFTDERPKHTSKGCIHLHDVVGIAALPSYSAAGDDTTLQLPVALVTPALVHMLVFEAADAKASFERALGANVPRSMIVAEDWSIVQLEHGQSKESPYVRYYIVFLTSGDLLFFTDGNCRLLEARVRMLDLENVLVAYDSAAGNGVVLSPRSQARAAASLASPSIQLVVHAKVISLEFDAKTQYELWRELLVDAAAGDYYGRAFLQRRLQDEQRKKYQRQAKLDDMLKKTKKKISRHKKQHLKDPRVSVSDVTYDGDDLSEVSTLSHASYESALSSTRSRTSKSAGFPDAERPAMQKKSKKAATTAADASEAKPKTTKKRRDEALGEEGKTPQLPPAADESTRPLKPRKKSKKPKGVVLDAETSVVIAPVSEPTPPSAPTPSVLAAPATALVPKKNLNRVREDIFASPVTSPTFAEKKQALLRRLQPDYSPLSPKVKVETTQFVPEPVSAPRTRRRQRSVTSSSSIKHFASRRELLQMDFEKLCARMQSSANGRSTKQARRLERQIQACAQAIDTLGGLVLFPPTDEALLPPILPMLASLELSDLPKSTVDVQGNWFTTEQRGGVRVRHWQRRHAT